MTHCRFHPTLTHLLSTYYDTVVSRKASKRSQLLQISEGGEEPFPSEDHEGKKTPSKKHHIQDSSILIIILPNIVAEE